MIKSFEKEKKVLIRNKYKFDELIRWQGEELNGWQAQFSFIRKTFFLDTVNNDYERNGESLAIVMNAGFNGEIKNKLVFKQSKYDSTIKNEYTIEFTDDIDHAFTQLSGILPNMENSDLIPQVIIRQERHKRGCFINSQPLYLSFDEVRYLDSSNYREVLDTIYICEIESSSTDEITLLNNLDMQRVLDIINEKFGSNIIEISKKSYGMSIYNSGYWNTKRVFKSVSDCQAAFETLIKDFNRFNQESVKDFKNIKSEVERIYIYLKVMYHLDIKNSTVRNLLIKTSKIRNVLLQRKNETSVQSDFINLYRTISREIKFPIIKDSENNPVVLTRSNYSQLLSSSDGEIRKSAFFAMYKAYEPFSLRISECLQEIILNNPKQPYEDVISDGEVRKKYMNYLVTVTDNYLHIFHRYIHKRKTILNTGELFIYDMQCLLNRENDCNFSYYDSIKILKSTIGKFADEEILNKTVELMECGHIDISTSTNKVKGNYTIESTRDQMPFIAVEFKSDIRSVISLSHEVGHALGNIYNDSVYSYEDLPKLNTEIQASVHEALILAQLKQQYPHVVNEYYVEKYRSNFYRLMLLSEFENTLFTRIVEKKERMVLRDFNEIYYELLKKYYGNNIEIPKCIEIEWSKVSHIFQSPYSTGLYPIAFIFGEYIANKIISQELSYSSIFQGVSRDTHLYLQELGINMYSPVIYNSFFEKFSDLIDQF